MCSLHAGAQELDIIDGPRHYSNRHPPARLYVLPDSRRVGTPTRAGFDRVHRAHLRNMVPAQRRTGHTKRPPLTLLTPRLLVHCVVTPWLLSVTAIGALSGAEGARPNIIVITVDALRADHLGVYGYTRPTSPSIDAFAKGAVVVSDGISQAPYTKASVASLLTGLYPTTHKTYTTKPKVGQLMTTGVGKTALPYTDILGAEFRRCPRR